MPNLNVSWYAAVHGGVIHLTPFNNKEEFEMLDFSKCRPIELDDLVRIGSENDGGYILSKQQIESTDILLSFGINNDLTFEKEFFQRENVNIYVHDYSIKDAPFVSKTPLNSQNKRDIGFMVINFFRLITSKVKTPFEKH